MIEIDPADNQIRVEHAQEIIDEAYSSPIEGARKAIIVFEAERLNEAAANKLLKTLEEPPASVLLVLVTAGADQLLPTILSRCQRVDFANLAAGTIERVLTEAGVAPERADLVARLAGGRLDRAACARRAARRRARRVRRPPPRHSTARGARWRRTSPRCRQPCRAR